jgi:tRNA(adenine34) deaminase
MLTPKDREWMLLALDEARAALRCREVPVGAVVVAGDRLLGRGHNQVESLQDPTAHAEIIALGAAADALGSWRLEGATLYVSVEPCVMCAGAALHARVQRIVYGASEPKTGAFGSLIDLYPLLRRRPDVATEGGLLAEEAARLLRTFFESLRSGPGDETP